MASYVLDLGDLGVMKSGIFLGRIWGCILVPSQLKNEQKLPKMVYINTNFLALYFGENLMEI